MALGKQGKIKKHDVIAFFIYLFIYFYLQKVNGAYHGCLVIIGSQTHTQSLFMCVCRLRGLSGRLRRAGCHGKGRRKKKKDGSNRMFLIEMIRREFENKSNANPQRNYQS